MPNAKNLILILFILFFPTLSIFAQTQSQLFQQALLKENGEGDLKGAVAIYEKIVQDKTADRAIQAKAQLHIGMCWEKMGKQEAIEAYKKVIKKFDDQKTIVDQASQRLKELTIKSSDITAQRPIYEKIIETDGTIMSADYSPNGKWIVFSEKIDTATNVWIIERQNKQKNLLMENVSLGIAPLKWSPSGEYISYGGPMKPISQSGLWIVPVDQTTGFKTGIAHTIVDSLPIIGFDWHPAEPILCYAYAGAKGAGLSVIDLRTNEPKHILENSKATILSPCWANDGASILFSSKGTSGVQSFDIFHLDVTTKELKQIIDKSGLYDIAADDLVAARSIVQSPVILKMVSLTQDLTQEFVLMNEFVNSIYGRFSPNGTKFLLPSRRRNANINKINLKDGTIVQINDEQGYYYDPVIAHDGRTISYIKGGTETETICLYKINGDNEKIITVDDILSYPAWSPNGKHILYQDTYKNRLVLLDIETGLFKTLDKYLETSWDKSHWSPDGRKISYSVRNDKDGLYLIDLEGNKKLLASSDNYITTADWFSDNDKIVYAISNGSESSNVIIQSLSSEDKKVFPVVQANIKSPTLSPDEKWIAFIGQKKNEQAWRLYLLASETGGEAKKITPSSVASVEGFSWIPDNEHILVNGWESDGMATQIYLIDTTGALKQIFTKEKSIKYGLIITPDGTDAYYWYQYDTGSNLWELDFSNLLD